MNCVKCGVELTKSNVFEGSILALLTNIFCPNAWKSYKTCQKCRDTAYDLCVCGHEQVNHKIVERTDTEEGYWGKCFQCSCKRFEKA